MAMTQMSSSPSRASRPSGLADVIELILDKGLVIDAFVRVSVVGIELLVIDARIVVASVDTYLRFAEAVNRLDLTQSQQSMTLPDMLEGGVESAGKKKGMQAVEKGKEAVTAKGRETVEKGKETVERGKQSIGTATEKVSGMLGSGSSESDAEDREDASSQSRGEEESPPAADSAPAASEDETGSATEDEEEPEQAEAQSANSRSSESDGEGPSAQDVDRAQDMDQEGMLTRMRLRGKVF
jgi:gas vesicle structural protein